MQHVAAAAGRHAHHAGRATTRGGVGEPRHPLGTRVLNRHHWKATTVTVYANVLKRLTRHFGAMPLGSIRPRDVAAYVAEQLDEDREDGPLGAATVNRDVGIFYDVLKTARTEELIDSNPAEGANRPRIPKRNWRILKPEEIRRVSKAFTDD